MAGQTVSRNDLDYAASQTVVAVRDAFRKVKTINAFLERNSADESGGDPLTLPVGSSDEPGPGKFGYTEDEAYLIRLVFQQLGALDVQPTLDTARGLTGLL